MAKVVPYEDFSTLVAASDMDRLTKACTKHMCSYQLGFSKGKWLIRVGNLVTGDAMATADRSLSMVILAAKMWFERTYNESLDSD